jgi:hypothetical protein
MSNSLVLVHSRSNELHVFEPDAIPHTDDLSPLMHLAAEVIKAGYSGVAVDELRLQNGRFVLSMDVDLESPEGLVMRRLSLALDEGRPLPNAPTVLEAIRRIYERCEKNEQGQQTKAEENSK